MKLFTRQPLNLIPGLLLFLGFIFSAGLSPSQSATAQDASNPEFEGTIDYLVPAEASSRDRDQEFTYMARGNQGRIEFSMEGGRRMALLVDSKQQQLTMLMPEAKAYMEFPLNQNDPSTHSSDKDGSKLQKMDETQIIAGKQCQLWRVEDEGKIIDIWVANGMGNFLLPGTEIPRKMGPLQMKEQPGWIKEAAHKGFMPLKVTVTENEETRTLLVAQNIEEKSLASSLFAVPPEFQNMSQMMRQMMKGQGK